LNAHDTSTEKEKTQSKIEKALQLLWEFIVKFFRKLHDPKFFVEVWALVGLFAYACITYNQWQDSNRNFTIDERAWLYVQSPSIMDLKTDNFVQWNLTLKNTGKTMCKKIHTEFFATIRKNSDPEVFDYSHSMTTDMALLPPGGETIIQVPRPR